jgi:hypothetical protein
VGPNGPFDLRVRLHHYDSEHSVLVDRMEDTQGDGEGTKARLQTFDMALITS